MLQALFHTWERRLASVSKDRVVRPFEWGLDWIARVDGSDRGRAAPAQLLDDWVSVVMSDTDAFFTPEPTTDYVLKEQDLSFPSALPTPHDENNTVRCRFFVPRQSTAGAAVLVLPQWNADAN